MIRAMAAAQETPGLMIAVTSRRYLRKGYRDHERRRESKAMVHIDNRGMLREPTTITEHGRGRRLVSRARRAVRAGPRRSSRGRTPRSAHPDHAPSPSPGNGNGPVPRTRVSRSGSTVIRCPGGRVEAVACGARIDLFGGLLEGPAVGVPPRGPGAQPVAAGELGRDLPVIQAKVAHPVPQRALLGPQAGLGVRHAQFTLPGGSRRCRPARPHPSNGPPLGLPPRQ